AAVSAFQQQPRDEYGQPVKDVAPAGPPPAQLILPAGTFIRVRVDDALSSDRNLGGDAFTATLAQPIVADGVVIARRGQIVEGVVAGTVRAGRAKGTSRLALELVRLSLVDGRMAPLETRVAEFAGGRSVSRDAEVAAMATATGAVIGAGAAGGTGAAIGAAVGAAAAGIGVLATRGRATEIYPEDQLTFRLTAPVTISTERAPHVFVPARQEDYEPASRRLRPPASVQPLIGTPVSYVN
ncbi:MAG: hypothetical protein IT162_15345, partial [Bryobacterales bacterium]|nr:hypothetical protein [Bryobacterales bacterium]